MPAADRTYGKPRRRTLQIGDVVAQTQKTWEQTHAPRRPVLITPGRPAATPQIARAVERKAATVATKVAHEKRVASHERDLRLARRRSRQQEQAITSLAKSIHTQGALQEAVRGEAAKSAKRTQVVKHGILGTIVHGGGGTYKGAGLRTQQAPAPKLGTVGRALVGRTNKELLGAIGYFRATPEKQYKGDVKAFRSQWTGHQHRAQVAAPAAKAIDITARPGRAIAGGLLAKMEGKDVLKAVKRNLSGKERTTFSDVLGKAGMSQGLARSILGFGLDVAADPTTWVTFGTSSLAREGAIAAARRASEKSLTEQKTLESLAKQVQSGNLSKPEAKRIARQRAEAAGRQASEAYLKKAAATAPHTLARGVRVRVAGAPTARKLARKTGLKSKRAPVALGTRGTALVGRAGRGATRPVRESTLGKATRNTLASVHAGIRPTVTSKAERPIVKALQRETRAAQESDIRRIGQRVNSLLGRVDNTEGRQIIDAIERNDIGSLRGQAGKLSAPVSVVPKKLGGKGVRLRPGVAVTSRATRHDPDRLYHVARQVKDDLLYLERRGRQSGVLTGRIGPKARTRLEGIHAQPEAGIQTVGPRSEPALTHKLAQASADLKTARAEVANAPTPSARIAAKRKVTAAEQRRENFRKQRIAVRKQLADVTTAKGARQASVTQRLQTEARGYFPRPTKEQVKSRSALSELADPTSRVGTVRVGVSKPEPGATKFRKHRPSRAELRVTEPQVTAPLTENVREALAHYGVGMGKGAAAADLNSKLMDRLGKPISDFTKGRKPAPRTSATGPAARASGRGRTAVGDISKGELAQLEADGYRVYRLRQGGLEEMSSKTDYSAIRKAAQGGPLGGGGRVAVMRKDLVEHVRDPQSLLGANQAALRVFDAASGGFKSLALATPSYLARNLSGDLFNAWGNENSLRLARNFYKGQKALRDLNAYENALGNFERQIEPGKRTIKLSKSQTNSVADAMKLTPEARDALLRTGKISAGQVALLAERVGVIRQGRFLEVMGDRSVTRPRGSRLRENVTKHVEDSTRIATFLGGLQRGMDPREAAQRASDIHFDYGDLTSIEKSVFRRAIPFYTFPSRNIPLQAKMLVTRPGKYATVAKAREEGRKAVGLEPGYEEKQNPYEARQLGVPIKWRGKTYTISMGSPFVDLNDAAKVFSGHPVDAVVGKVGESLSPIVRVPPEVIYNTSLFLRDQIQPDQEPYTRAPQWAIDLAKRNPAFKQATGMVSDYAPGEGDQAWGWPRKADYIARQLQPGPIAGVVDLMGKGVKGGNARNQSKAQRLLAAGLGVRATTWDRNKAEITRLYNEKNDVDKKVYMLRRRFAPDKSGERIGVDHPTPEFTRLFERQNEIQSKLDELSKIAKPKGFVGGHRVRPTVAPSRGGFAPPRPRSAVGAGSGGFKPPPPRN